MNPIIVGCILLFLCANTLAAAPLLPARSAPEVTGDSPLFSAKSWQPPAPVISQPRREVKVDIPPPPPPPPEAPPLPFSFAGRMFDGQQLMLFLLYNGQTLSAKAGDVLAQQYKLEQVSATQAVFTYLPYNIQQTLVFNSNNIGNSHWAAPAVTTQSKP